MATQQVIFKVNESEYGLDVAQVNAIETLTNVVPVPNAANHIIGIMNLRGEVLPIYSLRTKFGLQEIPVNEKTKIIVTKSNGVSIAFKVDEVKEIIECNADNVTDFPPIARSQETAYVDKVAKHNGQLILLLDQDRIIKEEEADEITKMLSNE